LTEYTQNNNLKFSRADRLYILAQVCKQNNQTPDSPAYFGLITRVCASKFNLGKDAAKEHAETLSAAYRADKWEALTKSETELEQDLASNTTATNITPQSHSVQAELKLLAQSAMPKPVQKIQTQQSEQQEVFTQKQQAQILHNLASQDTSDGIGRLILSTCRTELDNKHLSIQDIIALWRRHYPILDIEQRNGNILLIYWDGKTNIRENRQSQAPVNIEANSFHATPSEYAVDPQFKDAWFRANKPKNRIV
jgi:hypothetical protein